MAQEKRITGTYQITAGDMTISNDVTITGNLTVSGTTASIETTNSEITDKIVRYNKGETGSGVGSPGFSGIEIERGSVANALLVFDESDDNFKISTDGGASYNSILVTSLTGLTEVVDDTTPQLGGALDVNGKAIVSVSTNEDIQLQPAGTGRVAVDGALKLNDTSTPTAEAGATILYAKAAAGGGTGLHFVDGSTSDELVSKSKAIVYGLIF